MTRLKSWYQTLVPRAVSLRKGRLPPRDDHQCPHHTQQQEHIGQPCRGTRQDAQGPVDRPHHRQVVHQAQDGHSMLMSIRSAAKQRKNSTTENTGVSSGRITSWTMVSAITHSVIGQQAIQGPLGRLPPPAGGSSRAKTRRTVGRSDSDPLRPLPTGWR